MDNELKNTIENITICAEAVSELNAALNKYLGSFEKIQKTVTDVQKHEESAADMIDALSLKISAQIEKAQTWNNEVLSGAIRTLTELTAQTAELTERTGKKLESTLGVLTSTIGELEPAVNDLDRISSDLHSVSEKVAEIPQLSKVSKEIHNSLGILSDIDSLETISEKLDRKIAAIELEKKEITEPLKNAARFSEVVKAESADIHEKMNGINLAIQEENANIMDLLSAFSSKEPDSFTVKMSYLISVIEELSKKIDTGMSQKQGGWKALFGAAAKESDNSSDTVSVRKWSIRELQGQNLCVLDKSEWNNLYAFVPSDIDGDTVNGRIYFKGKYQDKKTYSASDKEFKLYRGEYLDEILDAEEKRDQIGKA